MRILFVSQELPPATPGGIGSYVQSTAEGLAAAGHEVHVLSCHGDQADSDALVGGVHVHRRGLGPSWVWRSAERSESARRLLAAACARRETARLGLDPDVVEAPEYLAEGLLLPRSTALVVTLHSPIGLVTRHSGVEPGPDGRLADRLESWSARRATTVVSPSALLADELRRTGWTGGRTVEVIPTAVDLHGWPHPEATLPTAPRVLCVGRVEQRKATLVLLEAAALLRPSLEGLELVLVGRAGVGREGEQYLERVRARADELGSWCRHVDAVPRPQLAEFYRAARVVAVPSRFDNYPMTALEAMACARPVVATSTTGVAGLVSELDPAAVVPPDDPEALAAALRPYLTDRDRADQVGMRARERLGLLAEESARRRHEVYEATVAGHRREG